MAGLAGGADAAYIHEEKFGIKDLMKVIHFRFKKEADHSRRFFFLMNSYIWVLYTYLIQLHLGKNWYLNVCQDLDILSYKMDKGQVFRGLVLR